ncbi:MAG TPA: DUF58 domain-containing protein [Blastocatellia bacterium]|nr:DUF58 domain-containing protein [Blastocatellia bacterium]
MRQYLSSDHHHHIDWKATAKTSQLMVREFTREDDWRVTIMFDARTEKELGPTPEFAEKFERGVMLAASLISHFARAGAETRLITVPITYSMKGPTTGIDDSGFGIGNAHSYKMFYQLARLAPAPAPDTDLGRDHEWARSDERFLIVIASGAGASRLNPRAGSVEFINYEEL